MVCMFAGSGVSVWHVCVHVCVVRACTDGLPYPPALQCLCFQGSQWVEPGSCSRADHAREGGGAAREGGAQPKHGCSGPEASLVCLVTPGLPGEQPQVATAAVTQEKELQSFQPVTWEKWGTMGREARGPSGTE